MAEGLEENRLDKKKMKDKDSKNKDKKKDDDDQTNEVYMDSFTVEPDQIPLYPPFRFGQAENGLYRGAYPNINNVRFLRRLNLHTIVSLTPEPLDQGVLRFCSEYSINPIHIKVDKPKENVPLSFSKTASILSTIIDPSNHPLYLHCLDGSGVTGVVMMCLRKLQGWNRSSSLNECLRYHKEGEVDSEESDFALKFQAEVELPLSLPEWLWGGSITYQINSNNSDPIPAQKYVQQHITQLQERKSSFDQSKDAISSAKKRFQHNHSNSDVQFSHNIPINNLESTISRVNKPLHSLGMSMIDISTESSRIQSAANYRSMFNNNNNNTNLSMDIDEVADNNYLDDINSPLEIDPYRNVWIVNDRNKNSEFDNLYSKSI